MAETSEYTDRCHTGVDNIFPKYLNVSTVSTTCRTANRPQMTEHNESFS